MFREQFSLFLPLGLYEDKGENAREMPFLSVHLVSLWAGLGRKKLSFHPISTKQLFSRLMVFMLVCRAILPR